MAPVNFNNSTRKPLFVLVSPLDWGLGHTTRCIPLIRYLLELDCQVLVGCNETQQELLFQEFGTTVTFLALRGYDVRYGSNKRRTIARLAQQSVKILTRIKEEKRWLEDVLTRYPVDLVLSDNRYGLYSAAVHTVFITHQLHIRTGLGTWADNWLQRRNFSFIARFAACWVPDTAGAASLAGRLAHPVQLPPVPVQYIGPLTRFTPCTGTSVSHLLILLSGPEPQRSIFESMLLDQLAAYPDDVVLVRGLPLAAPLPDAPANCTVLNHAPAARLQQLICAATLVIGRCGYTSVMDLLALQKKTILVPTPGQAEQEYLATHLQSQGWALTAAQQGFQLSAALQQAAAFDYQFPVIDASSFKPVMTALIAQLHKP